ncbi:MAG: sulfite exporter TauE/SafE family protein [Stackebrandtia sp.]
MPALIIIAVVGLAAQLIDGGLGMGYGVISSSLLLLAGLNPAAASASVHLAEIGTTLVSGASHWKFGNIHWPVVARIAVPGAAGAFIGAYALSSLPADLAKPWTSGILFIIGAYLLIRFSRGKTPVTTGKPPPRSTFLIPLGLVAGSVDATGGGGWGPIATPALLASGRLTPKKIIGSVSASEFAVAIAATAGFGAGSVINGVVWPTVAALLIGGIIAAPVAAWLVHKLPTRILGVAVGGIIIATNANTVLQALGATTAIVITTFTILTAAWATALTVVLRTPPAPTPEPAEAAA